MALQGVPTSARRGGGGIWRRGQALALHSRKQRRYISEWCGSEKRSRDSATFPPRKDAFPIRVAEKLVVFQTRAARGGQGTIGSLRRFFPTFLSLMKERWPSETGQGRSVAERFMLRTVGDAGPYDEKNELPLAGHELLLHELANGHELRRWH